MVFVAAGVDSVAAYAVEVLSSIISKNTPLIVLSSHSEVNDAKLLSPQVKKCPRISEFISTKEPLVVVRFVVNGLLRLLGCRLSQVATSRAEVLSVRTGPDCGYTMPTSAFVASPFSCSTPVVVFVVCPVVSASRTQVPELSQR